MFQENEVLKKTAETIPNSSEDSCFDVPLETIRNILSELKVHQDPSKLKIHWEIDQNALKLLK
jgi:hypothetical protein